MTAPETARQAERQNADQPGLTGRSAVLALGLSALAVLWVRHVSLIVHSCQVSEGTPSVPALTTLFLLSAIPVLLPRLRWLKLTPAEGVCVYLVVYLAVPLSGANSMRQLMPSITALTYFASPENDYGQFAARLPGWLAVTDEETARTFYEGLESEPFPWREWLRPLAVWTVLFIALNAALFAMLALFHTPWRETERLAFPLAQLALDMLPGVSARGALDTLLRQPLFWWGFAVAVVFNGLNMVHAFNPSAPALGTQFDMGVFFTEHPWRGLRPVQLWIRPEITGLGWLVSLDVLLSVWVFQWLMRLQNFATVLVGRSVPGMPFEWQQGHGAYLAIALALLWSARRHLCRTAREVVGAGDRARTAPRVAVTVLALGLATVAGICLAAGMTWLSTVWLLGGMLVSTLVYGRIRAQTGLPMSYCLPRRDIPLSLVDTVGCSPLLLGGDGRGLATFSVMTVITRMIFPQMAATQLEGLHMMKGARLRQRHLLGAASLGLTVGLALGYWSHLTAYYHYGANIIDGAGGDIAWRTRQALIQYDRAQMLVRTHKGPALLPMAFRGIGFLSAAALLVLRARFLRFPLHPLGFAIATTFGRTVWFPLFVTWLIKATALRLGGPRLYRQLTPAFIGLAVGHFLTAGALWGMVGAVSAEAARRYMIWFP